MSEDPQRLEEIFLRLLEVPPEDRAAALERECGSDTELRQRVEALLKAHQQPDSYLDQPGDAVAATFDSATLDSATQAGDSTPNSGEPFAAASRVGEVIAGRYTLEQSIGEGGMGEVWLAKQSEPVKRNVALKLIKTGMDSRTVLDRFEQERQALAIMDHPHIARVLDGGLTSAGQPFFVMELVNGLPLTQFCDEARLTLRERLDLFVPICQAVQHAHQKGIVHRDLKPANILVTMLDGQPVPKVIDFGVAKAIGGKLIDQSLSTQFGLIVGTLEYMSPEQAGYSDDDIDTRADIYSLGVILYELLTGLRPIDATRLKQAALTEMVRIIRDEEPQKPSTRVSTDESLPSLAAVRKTDPKKLTALLRGELDWIVMKCLEKQRDRRYETANGLLRDIQRYLRDEPVEARPPSARYRLGKLLKRNKGPAIAASVVLLTLIGGIIGTSLGWIEARNQAEVASARLVQVQEEKEKADLERQVALSVRDFLNNKLLGQADVTAQANALLQGGQQPALAKANPTIRELLDRAAAELSPDRIEQNFPNQPLVQAELLTTVGEAYLAIGHYEQGVELLERALELKNRHKADTIATRNSLAEGYLEVARIDEALRFAEETVELAKSELGPDDARTLTCMRTLIGAYHRAMRVPQALDLAQETVELSRAELGPDDPETLAGMETLAWVYTSSDTPAAAVPIAKQALDLTGRRLTKDHPDTLSRMNCLASVYREIGELEQALPLTEEAFQLTNAKLGPEHPTTLLRMVTLAMDYFRTGKVEAGLTHLEDALKITREELGPNHPAAPYILDNIASAYTFAYFAHDAEEGKQALSLGEEALELAQRNLGRNDPQTHDIMISLAFAYHEQKMVDKALPLLEEARELRAELVGKDHRSMIPILSSLGRAHAQLGDLDAAVPLYEEAIEISKAKLGLDHPSTIGELSNLAVVYYQSGVPEKAIPLFEESLEIARRKPGSPLMFLTLIDVVDSYIAAGQPAERRLTSRN